LYFPKDPVTANPSAGKKIAKAVLDGKDMKVGFSLYLPLLVFVERQSFDRLKEKRNNIMWHCPKAASMHRCGPSIGLTCLPVETLPTTMYPMMLSAITVMSSH